MKNNKRPLAVDRLSRKVFSYRHFEWGFRFDSFMNKQRYYFNIEKKQNELNDDNN